MNAAALLRGIVAADGHRGGIRCLRLFTLEDAAFQALQADVWRLCAAQRPSDAASPGHATSWTHPRGTVRQFSLWNTTGRCDDFSSDHDQSCLGKAFHAACEHAALSRFIDAFPHVVNFRASMLGPASELPPHEEHALIRTRDGGVGLRLRFHLPVFTNAAAELMLDGHVYHLEAGTLYFVNHGCVHSARNGHDSEARVHLTWDILLTHDAFACMFGDRELAFPAVRVRGDARVPATLRRVPVPAYRRIIPAVSAQDAGRVDFCLPQ